MKTATAPKVFSAEGYLEGLPRNGSGVVWDIESFSTYVHLLYPHIQVLPGQVWQGVMAKYTFVCEKHGPYEARAYKILNLNTGCRCKGCHVDVHVNSAGQRRCPRATPEEKERAAELRAEGLSYPAIGKILGRPHKTIQRWLNPEAAEKDRQRTAAYDAANRERINANARRYYSEFDHGKANNRAQAAQRRLLKTNTPELVFLDNQWC